MLHTEKHIPWSYDMATLYKNYFWNENWNLMFLSNFLVNLQALFKRFPYTSNLFVYFVNFTTILILHCQK